MLHETIGRLVMVSQGMHKVIWVAALLGGCVWTEHRPVVELPPEPPVEPPPAAAVMPPPAPPPPPTPPVDEPSTFFTAPSIRIEEVVGTTPADAGAMFEEMADPIQQCGGEGGGVLRVRLASDGASTFFSIDPESPLDPSRRECVFEALSLRGQPSDHSVDPSLSPSDRPPRVQSLMTIQWPGGPGE
jgi:hypothetical protein